MKIFVAGASGAIGRRMLPMLVAAGHDVVGTTRSPDKHDLIRKLGAEPVTMDGLDPESVRVAVGKAAPDVIIGQLSSLSGPTDLRHFDQSFALTNRLRTEGTDNLLAAARAAGTRRLVIQGFIGWNNQRTGGPVKSESDPLDPHPTNPSRQTVDAMKAMESTMEQARDVEGIVLRYGVFYGPGTGFAPDGEIVSMVRKRRLPVVGGGGGIWSFVHIDDAARATVEAVDADVTGVYNIVDDDPAPVSEWLPFLADVVGAKPPMHLPAWVARPLIGEHGISAMTVVRGSTNAKARRDLWQPDHPTWRRGFPEVLQSGA